MIRLFMIEEYLLNLCKESSLEKELEEFSFSGVTQTSYLAVKVGTHGGDDQKKGEQSVEVPIQIFRMVSCKSDKHKENAVASNIIHVFHFTVRHILEL